MIRIREIKGGTGPVSFCSHFWPWHIWNAGLNNFTAILAALPCNAFLGGLYKFFGIDRILVIISVAFGCVQCFVEALKLRHGWRHSQRNPTEWDPLKVIKGVDFGLKQIRRISHSDQWYLFHLLSPTDLAYLSDLDSSPTLGHNKAPVAAKGRSHIYMCSPMPFMVSIIRPLQNLQTGKPVSVINDSIGLSEISLQFPFFRFKLENQKQLRMTKGMSGSGTQLSMFFSHIRPPNPNPIPIPWLFRSF